MTARYGENRIRRGLMHFLSGKVISAIAGFMAMLLVIRTLSVGDFAAYSILYALVEIVTAISGFGIVHAILRYVPELYGKHYEVSLRHFILGSTVVRTTLLILLVFTFYIFSENVVIHIGLHGAVEEYKLFLVIVVLRSSTHFFSQILESTLHQGVVQIGFTIATVARLMGMVYLLSIGNVRLSDVIWIELVADGVGLLIMLLGVIWVLKSCATKDNSNVEDRQWLHIRTRQVLRFATAAYLQHLAITPYGGNANRLVGGAWLDSRAMAGYGFAQSIYEYIKRYLPAQLLLGIIRPVIVARYSKTRNFGDAVGLCNQVMHINEILIGGIFVILIAGSGGLVTYVSDGKYGAETVFVMAALLVVLILETWRQQLELLVQAIERYALILPSNLLLSLSVVGALLLLPFLSAVAFPVANAIGLVIANIWTQEKLRKCGYVVLHKWSVAIRVLLAVSISIGLGELLRRLGIAWHWLVILSAISYFTLCVLITRDVFLKFLNEFVTNGKARDQA